MINYSIIIPHYNIPDLLLRCIRSIPQRDDVEVIVVDDNSPNGESYLQRYPDLRRRGLTYIHLDKNIGGGGARNVGLKYAKGKWLIFADADDFFNYCFRDVLDEYVDNPCDVVYFNANSIDTELYINTGRSVPHNKRILSYIKNPNTDADYELRYSFGEPWCRFVKSELVTKHLIGFEETPIHNDTQFSYLVGFYASEICADNRAIYCLTDRMGSVSRILDPEKYLTRLSVFAKKYAFLHSNNIDFGDWRFIESSIEYYQENNLDDYLERAKQILDTNEIDFQGIVNSIKKKKQRNKHRNIKLKIIDRVNIELKKILCVE